MYEPHQRPHSFLCSYRVMSVAVFTPMISPCHVSLFGRSRPCSGQGLGGWSYTQLIGDDYCYSMAVSALLLLECFCLLQDRHVNHPAGALNEGSLSVEQTHTSTAVCTMRRRFAFESRFGDFSTHLTDAEGISLPCAWEQYSPL